MPNVRFSDFAVGGAPVAGDIFVGLRAGVNTQFTYPSFGTIASQDANNVAITGGTIDGIAAGSTTAYTILNVDNLRFDGNSIISTDAAGDIAITPDTTGDLVLDGLAWPQADGAAGQVLFTNGAGQLGWVNSPTVAGATTDNALARFDGVAGALQNSGVILSDTNAMSGITQLDVDNIRLDGNSITSTDAAGNLILTPDTTGDLVLDGLNWPQADGTVNQVLATNGAGQLSFIDVPVFGGPSTDNAIARFDGVAGDLQNSGVILSDTNGVSGVTQLDVDNIRIDGNAITSTDAAGNIALTPDTTGDLVLDGLNWPQADGTLNQALVTDGAAQLGWASVSLVTTPTVDDTLARFDGVAGALQDSGVTLSDADAMAGITQLDVDNVRIDGNSIVSTDAAGNLALTPDTTGDLVLDGLNWPQADGTLNQALVTNGAAQLSFASVSLVTTPTVDDTIARFDGVAGALQDSGITITDADVMSGATQLNVDNLRLDGNAITSTDAAGNIAITPDTTGDLVLDGLNWPQADGAAGQALTTNGAAQLGWSTVPTVTTPTVDNTLARFDGVGGALQDSSVTLDDADVMSGITQLNVDNLRLDGNALTSTDAAGNIVITPDTTGDLVLDGLNWPQADGTINQVLATNGAGQLSFIDVPVFGGPSTDNAIARFDGVAGDLQNSGVILSDTNAISGVTQLDVDNVRIDGNSIVSSDAAGDLILTPNTTGDLVLDGLNWPQADGGAGQAIVTNGGGQLSFATVPTVTTPTVDQTIARFDGVGGAIEDSSITISDADVMSGITQLNVDNLRLDGNSLTSTNAAGNILITPDTTGDLVLDGLNWPQADGTANQALITNGAAQLSFATVSLVTTPTVDQTIARFDGVAGALEDSGITISDADVLSGATQINVDNLRLDGNDLISTNAAGNINITPDTTGDLILDGLNWPQADGAAGQALTTNGAAQLGWTSVSTVTVPTVDQTIARFNGVNGAIEDTGITIDNSDVVSGVTQLNVDNLRLDGNTIISTNAAGNISLIPDTTGDLVLDGLNWPQTDGLNGQVLRTNGAAQLSWVAVSTFAGASTDNALARYDGVAGALQNSSVILDDLDAMSGITQLDVDNLRLNGNAITSTDAAGNIVITPDTTGDLVLDGLNWPQADGLVGQVLSTDGGGQLGWSSVANFAGPSTDNAIARYNGVAGALQNSGVIISDVDAVSGITQLDVDNIRIDGNAITSTDAAGDITITPDTTGDLVLDGLNWPQADGNAGESIITDGAGQLSFGNPGLVSLQVFSVSGTWNRPAGIKRVVVVVVGAGGGGAGTPATGGPEAAEGGGGAGGGCAIELIDVTATASVAVTVGAGGSGGAAGSNAGSAGGTSSFGAFCSATGGAGGAAGLATSGSYLYSGSVAGIGTGGDINLRGGAGSGGGVISGERYGHNAGGESFYSGRGQPVGGAGVAGSGIGTGGSGASVGDSTAAQTGGAGADGIVVVYEYA